MVAAFLLQFAALTDDVEMFPVALLVVCRLPHFLRVTVIITCVISVHCLSSISINPFDVIVWLSFICLIHQIRVLEVAAHRMYRRYRALPVLRELTPLISDDTDIGIVWCGSWRAHSSSVSHVQWIVENSTLMTAGTDGLARLWDHEVCAVVVFACKQFQC